MQNAHYHTSTNEMYIVQKGYIIMAIAEDNDVTFKRLEKNQYYNVGINISHNVFMGEDSVIHTIKYGVVPDDDWNYDEEVDKISKNYKNI